MDKQQLRKELLEGMCFCAQNIDLLYCVGSGLSAVKFKNSECPEPFKPSAGDKLIFNKIIEYVIDNISEELKEYNTTNPRIMGINIMNKFYYPSYGKWRIMPSRAELRKLYYK